MMQNGKKHQRYGSQPPVDSLMANYLNQPIDDNQLSNQNQNDTMWQFALMAE